MTQWHCKDLGDGVDAYEPSRQIKERFTPFFKAAGQPNGMAVYSRYDANKNNVTVYFSPEAWELAKLFGAIPCEKPEIEGLGMLVGTQRD